MFQLNLKKMKMQAKKQQWIKGQSALLNNLLIPSSPLSFFRSFVLFFFFFVIFFFTAAYIAHLAHSFFFWICVSVCVHMCVPQCVGVLYFVCAARFHFKDFSSVFISLTTHRQIDRLILMAASMSKYRPIVFSTFSTHEHFLVSHQNLNITIYH